MFSGWLLLIGVVLIVAGYVLIDGARDDGLTGDTTTPAARRLAGNIGCPAMLIGLVLVVAAVADLAIRWVLQ